MSKAIFSLILLVSVSLSGHAADHAKDHSHHHSATGLKGLHLDGGKKWATDKVLRENMTAIHASVKSHLPKIHSGKLSKVGYGELSQTIDKHIKSIFKSCKLPAKADAQLHIVLSEIMAGNQVLGKGPSDNVHPAVLRMIQAIKGYEKHFKYE